MRAADAMISVVVPAYCEGEHLAASLRRVAAVLTTTGHPFEIVVVDDGSTDDTWRIIREQCATQPWFVGVRLSRNFGKESALAAGLAQCRGRAAVVLDADLQHPPELIPEMVRRWREDGVDVVEAVKAHTPDDSLAVRARRRAFNGLVRRISGFDLNEASDFKLLDEKVLAAWRDLGERGLFFRGMVAWLGFRVERIPFDVAERAGGASKWSLRSLVNLALLGLTAFSAMPLRLASLLGGFFFLFAAGASVYTLVYRLRGDAQPGFTTVILLQMVTSSLILMCVGIIGEYIARIYEEVKARPRYIVAERVEARGRLAGNAPDRDDGAARLRSAEGRG